MLFTIYGDLKEIHAYKGKTLIAERSANMKNCIFYLSCSLYFEPFLALHEKRPPFRVTDFANNTKIGIISKQVTIKAVNQKHK